MTTPKGFAVQPDKLAAYKQSVADITAECRTIVGQLDAANLINVPSRLHSLLGSPDELGPSGPPVDFTKASGAMLGSYNALLTDLTRVHAAILGRLEHMTGALGTTLTQYLQADQEHSAAFLGLLADRRPIES